MISPYADLTVSPQINTKVNPFLNARYRQRFYSGDVDRSPGSGQFRLPGQHRRPRPPVTSPLVV